VGRTGKRRTSAQSLKEELVQLLLRRERKIPAVPPDQRKEVSSGVMFRDLSKEGGEQKKRAWEKRGDAAAHALLRASTALGALSGSGLSSPPAAS
jgi:hypothetical protein